LREGTSVPVHVKIVKRLPGVFWSSQGSLLGRLRTASSANLAWISKIDEHRAWLRTAQGWQQIL
jgi:hypothetical protein